MTNPKNLQFNNKSEPFYLAYRLAKEGFDNMVLGEKNLENFFNNEYPNNKYINNKYTKDYLI